MNEIKPAGGIHTPVTVFTGEGATGWMRRGRPVIGAHLAIAAPNTDPVKTGWKPDTDGMLPVPGGPGSKISRNMDVVEECTGEGFR